MNKLIIGSAVAALAAGAAIAQMPTETGARKMMEREPETRTAVEARVKAHFAEVDADKDGAITRAETEAYKSAMAAKMHDRMFDMLDADKNGAISRAEFSAHHAKMGQGMKIKHVMRGPAGMNMFDRADANNDGKVMLAEARDKALKAFDKADANRDGILTPEERKAAMRGMVKKRIIERREQ